MTDCTFCGIVIERGSGQMYVKRDGTTFHFCSKKCRKNMLDLGRVPRYVKWTKAFVKGNDRS